MNPYVHHIAPRHIALLLAASALAGAALVACHTGALGQTSAGESVANEAEFRATPRVVRHRRAARKVAGGEVDDALERARAASYEAPVAAQRAVDVAIRLDLAARVVAERTHVAYSWCVETSPEMSAAVIADDFGLRPSYLRARSPDIDPVRFERPEGIDDGTTVCVYRADVDGPSDSIGRPNRGRLRGGMPMIDGPAWTVRNRREAWGTPETVSHIARGLTNTWEHFGDAPVVVIGDLSRRRGGRMPPHLSHRTGRDADIAYYARNPERSTRFYVLRSSELDIERQWHLFKYWIDRDLVEYLFVDRRFQRRLYRHAQSQGLSEAELERIFEYPRYGGAGIIRHTRGHRHHFHVRFRCPDGDERCR